MPCLPPPGAPLLHPCNAGVMPSGRPRRRRRSAALSPSLMGRGTLAPVLRAAPRSFCLAGQLQGRGLRHQPRPRLAAGRQARRPGPAAQQARPGRARWPLGAASVGGASRCPARRTRPASRAASPRHWANPLGRCAPSPPRPHRYAVLSSHPFCLSFTDRPHEAFDPRKLSPSGTRAPDGRPPTKPRLQACPCTRCPLPRSCRCHSACSP